MSERLNVVLFAGGRGSATICDALIKHPQIGLTVLVNTYDDGLSTGKLREFIPGMLGPSDIRKNIARLIPSGDRSDEALRFLLEHRFNETISYESAMTCFGAFQNMGGDFSDEKISRAFQNLDIEQAKKIGHYTHEFLKYAALREKEGKEFDFGDCSLGNVFFSGCYIACNKDFNKAVSEFNQFCKVPAKILNITAGENLVLVGLKEDGAYLTREAEIVSPQNASSIVEIFLLDDYLKPEQEKALNSMSLEQKAQHLKKLSKLPRINEEAKEALSTADIVIYGPGTQHSSLLPSYLTSEVAETIATNTSAEKIFIANILKDHEIQKETANSLTSKLLYYMNRKGELDYQWNKVVSTFFFQASEETLKATKDYVKFQKDGFAFPMDRVILTDWEIKDGAHSGGRVLDELIALVNARLERKLKPFPYLVSFVVPGLDESRTVKKVLHELKLLDVSHLGLGKEIIFVDGGSTDKTDLIAEQEGDIRVYRMKKKTGRGEAIRHGIEKASGNIIVVFHSDAEYDTKDLIPILQVIVKSEFRVVFGSRAIKCVNLNDQIREIYKGNSFGYFVSKFGGIAVSVVSLLLYNRFVSDPFTGIKAFDARLLKGLNLKSKDMDLETEIVAKLGKHREFILEMPVNFFPRKKTEGKKTTILGGLKALFALFKYKVFT